MKIMLFIIIFLLIGAFFVISENNLALRNSDARKTFNKLYLSWFGQVFDNSVKLTGYIVKLDWLPGNKSE